jgi:hypothetical protein
MSPDEPPGFPNLATDISHKGKEETEVQAGKKVDGE